MSLSFLKKNIPDGETQNKTLKDKIFKRTVKLAKISSNLFEIQSKREVKTVMYYGLPGGKYMLPYLQINSLKQFTALILTFTACVPSKNGGRI